MHFEEDQFFAVSSSNFENPSVIAIFEHVGSYRFTGAPNSLESSAVMSPYSHIFK